jgi:2-succinyl-5-enolpyruvyl-6-hydroxy-3-cyclohexene-1-carboxylate synthase
VHLNLSFRDPLVPRPSPGGADADGTADAIAAPERIVVTRRLPAPAPAPQPVPVDSRTVVVAGDGAGPAAAALADEHTLPLLAEPSSGALGAEGLVPRYPALLREVMADPAHPLRPKRAIVLGHPTLSRPVVGALLGAADVEVVVVDPQLDWPDVARRASLVVPAAIGQETDIAPDVPARRAWIEAWRSAADATAARLPQPWQQRAALTVWEASGPEDLLVLGSSSLVRDLEQHAGPTAARVIANRGLAGIDGTTAMAGGLALARAARGASGERGRTRLLVGDLTALHDLTGMLVGPEEPRPELDVIVVDDGGGRIFSGLEHAAAPPELLRRFFTTPHGADIAAAAVALGAEALEVGPDRLPDVLSTPSHGLRVLVVQEPSSDVPSNS